MSEERAISPGSCAQAEDTQRWPNQEQEVAQNEELLQILSTESSHSKGFRGMAWMWVLFMLILLHCEVFELWFLTHVCIYHSAHYWFTGDEKSQSCFSEIMLLS